MRLGATGDEVRGRVAHVRDVYAETRATVLEEGVLDQGIKRLCARYLAEDDDVVTHAGDSGRFDERERAALEWAHAIEWDSNRADDALWERLHAQFTEAELVELGYFIAFSLGQRHWLATLGIAG